jgi:hypothetical protein
VITDPDVAGYRYPAPGERLWHAPWQCWMTVRAKGCTRCVPDDEVAATREDNGVRVVVKLRSLEER